MKNFFKNYTTDIIYLVIAVSGIWLLSAYWLPNGATLGGHDSGLAIDAKHFLFTRFYAWSQQGFGQDNSLHFGSIMLHGLDYLFSIIAGVTYAGNNINVFYWLTLIFLSGFIFSYSLKDKLGKYAPYLFPVFVTFNFFILQSIFILERAKYSVFIALLLFSTITFKLIENKISVIKGALLSSIVLFVFNCGSWLGIPLYGGFLVFVFCVVVFNVFTAIKYKSYASIVKLLKFLFITFFLTLLLDSYSILPYLSTFFSSGVTSLTELSSINGNKAWLDYISQASSSLNILRLQGVPDWYLGSNGINPEHAYAKEYLSNSLLIIVSFLFPIISFSSVFFIKAKKQRDLVTFLILLALVAMFFMQGTHSPFGQIYAFFYTNIPGFSIFRSPYYKFAPGFFLAISALISFVLSSLIIILKDFCVEKNMHKKILNIIPILCVVILILGWITYHSIFFYPEKIFTWQTGLSTRFKVPEYIIDFSNWSQSHKNEGKRFLLLPPLNESWQSDAYDWGYWSLSSLPSVIGGPSFLANDLLFNADEKSWVNALYQSIRDGDDKKMSEMMVRLDVGYLLLREDVLQDNLGFAEESPEVYKNRLKNSPLVKRTEQFGKWTVYVIDLPKTGNKVSALNSVDIVSQQYKYLGHEFLTQEHFYLSKVPGDTDNLNNFIDQEVNAFSCESCILEEKNPSIGLPQVRILPSSPLYGFKLKRDMDVMGNATTFESKINTYLGIILRRAAEVKVMINSKYDDKYSIQSLKTINTYLDNVQTLLKVNSDPNADYFQYSLLFNMLNPIQSDFRDYITTTEFRDDSTPLRDQIFDMLWKIQSIFLYYEPIVGNKEKLQNEKKYYLNLPKDNNRHFYIKASTLPNDEKGDFVFPSSISYQENEIQQNLSIGENINGWVEIIFPSEAEGKITLTLKFDNLPDLYRFDKQALKQSPDGVRSCNVGRINLFSTNKKYNVKILSEQFSQSLTLYIQGSDKTKNENSFIHGDEEVNISGPSLSEPFRFYFQPSKSTSEPLVLLCSSNRISPKIKEISIQQIYSPLIVSVKGENVFDKNSNLPQLTSVQINPTEYNINIRGATSPYLLLFDERYSPEWKVGESEKSKSFIEYFVNNVFNFSSRYEINSTNHITLDGYSNAWVINKLGDYDLTIEYAPQKKYYLGLFITAISLIASIVIVVFIQFRKKRPNNSKDI